MAGVKVIKASREIEDFSEYKLRHSLLQAGVKKQMINDLLAWVEDHLTVEMATMQIHNLVNEYLQEKDQASLARYNLRQAIMQLGPTGYPFEKYVGEILRFFGYEVQTNKIVHGACVAHEVDIVAHKDQTRYMIECKFHNKPGSRSDVKTALYIWARFEDVSEAWERSKLIEEKIHHAWLVTNTKMTEDAEHYARCKGLKIVSWYKPYREGLKDLIVKSGLWPITCLRSLDKKIVNDLVEKNIVLCRDFLSAHRRDLKGLNSNQMKQAKQEAEFVCQLREIEVEEDIP